MSDTARNSKKYKYTRYVCGTRTPRTQTLSAMLLAFSRRRLMRDVTYRRLRLTAQDMDYLPANSSVTAPMMDFEVEAKVDGAWAFIKERAVRR